MKSFKSIYKEFISLFNIPSISQELLKEIKGPVLLHISDTPVDIYTYIFRIVDILKPKYIVHTGDMADNIKLGNCRNRVAGYKQGVSKLITGLEKYENTKTYYVLGNHDDYETINQLTNRGTILDEGIIEFDGYSFAVGHYHKDYSCNPNFNLYGHSFEPSHYEKNGTIGLNGLLHINIIELSNKNVFRLEYPIGTNISRRMELGRIGI